MVGILVDIYWWAWAWAWMVVVVVVEVVPGGFQVVVGAVVVGGSRQ